MQLSTKARYAARAMIELAAHYGKGPILLKVVAQKQEISEKYLEQLMAPLRASGMIYTLRGNKGGYILGKDPAEITLYEVINVVEGSLAPVPCVDRAEICNRNEICVTSKVWADLKEKIVAELKGITLSEMVERQQQKYKDAGILTD